MTDDVKIRVAHFLAWTCMLRLCQPYSDMIGVMLSLYRCLPAIRPHFLRFHPLEVSRATHTRHRNATTCGLMNGHPLPGAWGFAPTATPVPASDVSFDDVSRQAESEGDLASLSRQRRRPHHPSRASTRVPQKAQLATASWRTCARPTCPALSPSLFFFKVSDVAQVGPAKTLAWAPCVWWHVAGSEFARSPRPMSRRESRRRELGRTDMGSAEHVASTAGPWSLETCPARATPLLIGSLAAPKSRAACFATTQAPPSALSHV
ncbi:hypothetical protein B296_00008844 [Ensete ventricosum]|uniref:Uncharacterized protein n=1 Tax=Ensete ventricosum TaxID=4639 RepID=A0A427AS23_ENSVE|nr:hypothetical protein B296_00008844 [Ensete ventricosum]